MYATVPAIQSCTVKHIACFSHVFCSEWPAHTRSRCFTLAVSIFTMQKCLEIFASENVKFVSKRTTNNTNNNTTMKTVHVINYEMWFAASDAIAFLLWWVRRWGWWWSSQRTSDEGFYSRRAATGTNVWKPPWLSCCGPPSPARALRCWLCCRWRSRRYPCELRFYFFCELFLRYNCKAFCFSLHKDMLVSFLFLGLAALFIGFSWSIFRCTSNRFICGFFAFGEPSMYLAEP